MQPTAIMNPEIMKTCHDLIPHMSGMAGRLPRLIQKGGAGQADLCLTKCLVGPTHLSDLRPEASHIALHRTGQLNNYCIRIVC